MPAAESSSSTSASLLDRVRQLDPEAWDRLTRLYSPLVYRWCRQAALQDTDAADVSQEVFRSVAGGIAKFHRDQPGDSFRGWLWSLSVVVQFALVMAVLPAILGMSKTRHVKLLVTC